MRMIPSVCGNGLSTRRESSGSRSSPPGACEGGVREVCVPSVPPERSGGDASTCLDVSQKQGMRNVHQNKTEEEE